MRDKVMEEVEEKFSIGDKVYVNATIHLGYPRTDDEGDIYRTMKTEKASFEGIVVGGIVRYEGKWDGEEEGAPGCFLTLQRHVMVLVRRKFFGRQYECWEKHLTIMKGESDE